MATCPAEPSSLDHHLESVKHITLLRIFMSISECGKFRYSILRKTSIRNSGELSMIFICPKPPIWYEIHERLLAAWRTGGHEASEPPKPLILNGWVFSSDVDKLERWQSTVQWAEEMSLSHLIPHLAVDDQYCSDHLSTSYPEQHYRTDRCVCRQRPSEDEISTALNILKRDWQTIAGSDLARLCEPARITGVKARRLLVTVLRAGRPPWGSWDVLSHGPERRTFSAFRQRVNEAIKPVTVDHIDFEQSQLQASHRAAE
jgi:hypothetical protein